jgi:hypothetical protein
LGFEESKNRTFTDQRPDDSVRRTIPFPNRLRQHGVRNEEFSFKSAIKLGQQTVYGLAEKSKCTSKQRSVISELFVIAPCHLQPPTKSDQQESPVFEEFGWLTFDDVSKHLANPTCRKQQRNIPNPRTSGAIRKSGIETAIIGTPNV